MRSGAATDRLLEDSWEARTRRLPRREILTEMAAAVLFLVTAGGLLLLPGATSGFDIGVTAVLVVVYVVLAGIEFPVGNGNVLPTQLVLVPMLVLLPPGIVPLAVAAGLLLSRLSDWVRRQATVDYLLFSIPDAWHAVGPAAVLLLAGAPELDVGDLPLLSAAFVACCLFDAGSATLREAAARGVAPTLQLKVLALVWVVDACLAPIGFLASDEARDNILAILLVLPLAGLLVLLARDRRKRIERAQHRLEIAERERSRLQSAVRRMGDAFAAKLDLDALVDIMLRGSIEALDGDAGVLRLDARVRCRPEKPPADLAAALEAAPAFVGADAPQQEER